MMPRILPVPPRRFEEREIVDDPEMDDAALSASMKEVRLLNRMVGGTATVRAHVGRLLSGRKMSLLDVGTGTADTPVALFRWAARAGIRLDITGLDISPQMLEEARHLVHSHPITLALGDARDLPWPAESFDIVTSLGVLHHFDDIEARQVLREMWRVARVGIVAVDLQRTYLTYVAAWLAMHTIVRNPVTQHDGLVSVLRSFTSDELLALARAADVPNATVGRHRLILQSLVAKAY